MSNAAVGVVMSRSVENVRVKSPLGHGVSLPPTYYARWSQLATPPVDSVELQADELVLQPPRVRASAEQLRNRLPLSLYCGGLGLGNSGGPTPLQLRVLNSLIEQLEPALVSAPLCWDSVGSEQGPIPLPIVRTRDAVASVSSTIRRVQDHLQQRILVKNIASYIEYTQSNVSEVQFLGEVLAEADCWLLLDLGALYINSVNHGFDPYAFIRRLPAERIQQIRLSSFVRDEGDGAEPLLVESSDALIPLAIYNLLRTTIEHCGPTPSVVPSGEGQHALAEAVAQCQRTESVCREAWLGHPLRASA